MNEKTILTIMLQKIKKFISLLGAEMQKSIQRFVYQVTTVNASSGPALIRSLSKSKFQHVTVVRRSNEHSAAEKQ